MEARDAAKRFKTRSHVLYLFKRAILGELSGFRDEFSAEVDDMDDTACDSECTDWNCTVG